MSITKVLKASRLKEVINQTYIKICSLSCGSQCDKKSQLKSSEGDKRQRKTQREKKVERW